MAQPDKHIGSAAEQMRQEQLLQEFRAVRRRDGSRIVAEGLRIPDGDPVLAAMIDAAQTVFKPLRNAYDQHHGKNRITKKEVLTFSTKGDETQVSDHDVVSQVIIKEILDEAKQENESVAYFGEERDLTPLRGVPVKHRFDIDPLDGTGAFRKGKNDPSYFAVSIADTDETTGETARSVILDGRTGDLIVGVGDSVYLIPAKITRDQETHLISDVSTDIDGIQKLSMENREETLERSKIGKKYPIAVHINKQDDHRKNMLDFISNELNASGEYDVQNPGSLVLDLLRFAKGEYRFVINGGCHWWDIAAARHIFKIFGGEESKLRMEPWNIDRGGEMPQYNPDAAATENRKAGSVIVYIVDDEALVKEFITRADRSVK